MADTRDRVETVAATEESPPGADLPPEPTPSKPRRRRPLFILLAVVLGVVIYALAFQQTQVSLDQITSETRQASLSNILRALAQPELVTYDTTPEITDIDVAVPCGPSNLATSPGLVTTPSCGDPGDVVTVSGSGYEPREAVEIHFVPDSEFDITLRLAIVNADSDGNFTTEITLPDRPSDQPQQLRAETAEPIGSWRNRVEVFTDANGNGVEDDPILAGSHTVAVEGDPDIPAAALLNPANEVVEFSTTGEPFDAVDGQARGQTAIPLTEDIEISGLHITGIAATDGEVDVTVEGPDGFDMSNWRVAAYDGATGEVGATQYVSDTIQLSPRVSETAKITLDKILETVFLALIATTAGLMLAVPLSFVSARNIMRDISITVTNLVLILLAIPLGVVVGVLAGEFARTVVDPVAGNLVGSLLALVVTLGTAWLLLRWALPPVEEGVPTRVERVRRGLMLVAAGVAGLIALLLTSRVFQLIGEYLIESLGAFGFIGSFFAAIGEILEVALVVIAALTTAGAFAHLASKLGYVIRSSFPRPAVGILNVVLAGAGGAVWAMIVGQIIDWFYQIGNPRTVVVIPAIVGAIVGIGIALLGMRKGEVPIGLSIYYAARTVFNTLRSIEPLVMAIVFVVWVGAGPFAGSLALALHTAAALAKLYSEQVESISPGPIEAVRATGANRLQTIIYSVVPQIVPPYISFTMYRWDINVRMSTILGFVGGGGIGSVLQQNINLLQYRAAAVQMLAIAIVVASMDYASSRMRERFV